MYWPALKTVVWVRTELSSGSGFRGRITNRCQTATYNMANLVPQLLSSVDGDIFAARTRFGECFSEYSMLVQSSTSYLIVGVEHGTELSN